MNKATDLRAEAQEALEKIWFVQAIEQIEHTDITLSFRLHIRPGLFIQVFWGERSNSLYFALIEGSRRIFGIDREHGDWHMHPYDFVDSHQPLAEGLEPKPLLRFLGRVEELLLEHDLL